MTHLRGELDGCGSVEADEGDTQAVARRMWSRRRRAAATPTAHCVGQAERPAETSMAGTSTFDRRYGGCATQFHPATIQQNQPKDRGTPWNTAASRGPEAPTKVDDCDRSRRTRNRDGSGGLILITQRSLVQIQPPQPSKSTGYGTPRSPLGFPGNVRLSFTAVDLIIRERVGEHFADNRSNPKNRPKSVQVSAEAPVG